MKKKVGCFNIKKKYVDNMDNQYKNTYDFILFKGDGGDLSKKKHLEKEEYSLTLKKDADELSRFILTFCKTNIKNLLVIDGTTSIGGNFLSFIHFFKNIIGVEVNNIRFNKLMNSLFKENYIFKIQSDNKVYQYKSKTKNVILINESFVSYLPFLLLEISKYQKSLIYLDPPWGGKDYKKYDFIVLGLHGYPLHKIIKYIKAKTNKDINFIIKLPKNYLLNTFKDFKYEVMNTKSYIYIIL